MNKGKKNPRVTIIGVPTNSSGKTDGVAKGPSALRRAGLIDALASHCEVRDYGDVLFSQPIPQRSTDSGIIAERSLISMIYAVKQLNGMDCIIALRTY